MKNEGRAIGTDPTDIKMIIREYYTQIYNKFYNFITITETELFIKDFPQKSLHPRCFTI